MSLIQLKLRKETILAAEPHRAVSFPSLVVNCGCQGRDKSAQDASRNCSRQLARSRCAQAYWEQARGTLDQRRLPVARRQGRLPSWARCRCRPPLARRGEEGGLFFSLWPAPVGPKTRGCPGLEQRWSLGRLVCCRAGCARVSPLFRGLADRVSSLA